MDMEMSQCPGGFSAGGFFPPGLVQNPTSDMTRSNMDNDENPEKCEHEEWINRNLHSPWICANHQHGWENSDMQIYDIMDIAEWYPNTMDCLQPEEGNCLSHAAEPRPPLIGFIRHTVEHGQSIFAVTVTGSLEFPTLLSRQDADSIYRPSTGYLSRCLYWPWSLHRMTQCQAKIKGPVVNILTRVIVDDGGLWDIRISVTLPATHAGMELYPTVIGRRASATSDWPRPAGSGSALYGVPWSMDSQFLAVTVTGFFLRY